MDLITAAQIATILYSFWQAHQANQEKKKSLDTLEEIKQVKLQQLEMNKAALNLQAQYQAVGLSMQLQQHKQQFLLEQFERLRQGIRDRALQIVSAYAAGIAKGGTAKAMEIQSQLDTDKDLAILKRNFLNIGAQLGYQKDALEAEYLAALKQMNLQKSAIEKSNTWEALQLASQYNSIRNQYIAQGLQLLSTSNWIKNLGGGTNG